MSESLARVRAALEAAGAAAVLREMAGGTRTVEDAARANGCAPGRIAEAVIFRGEDSGAAMPLITAGDGRADPDAAVTAAGEPPARADALVRERAGFAIGGVAPIAHLRRPRAFWDRALDVHATVWPAAGTPRHVFEVAPHVLGDLAGTAPADSSMVM